MAPVLLVVYALGAGCWAAFGLATFSSRGEFDNRTDALLDCIIYIGAIILWPLATFYFLKTGDVFRRKEYEPSGVDYFD
jgi:hypothetical protein